MHRLHEVLKMCSDSEKNMSAFAEQNHAPSLTCVRLDFVPFTRRHRLPRAHINYNKITAMLCTLIHFMNVKKHWYSVS